MRGVSHALSGAAAGGAWAEIVQRATLTHTAELAGFTAGMALLSDLDHPCGSASRCLGFITEALSFLVRKASGGHRHATHGILGIGVFTLVAWFGVTFRHGMPGEIVLGLLVLIATSSALEALHLADGHVADVIGAAVAAGVVWYGYGLGAVLTATVLGTVVHSVFDDLTISGIMWLYPVSRRKFYITPRFLRFTTGKRAECWIVRPLLVVAVAVLGTEAVAPGLVLTAWNTAFR